MPFPILPDSAFQSKPLPSQCQSNYHRYQHKTRHLSCHVSYQVTSVFRAIYGTFNTSAAATLASQHARGRYPKLHPRQIRPTRSMYRFTAIVALVVRPPAPALYPPVNTTHVANYTGSQPPPPTTIIFLHV